MILGAGPRRGGHVGRGGGAGRRPVNKAEGAGRGGGRRHWGRVPSAPRAPQRPKTAPFLPHFPVVPQAGGPGAESSRKARTRILVFILKSSSMAHRVPHSFPFRSLSIPVEINRVQEKLNYLREGSAAFIPQSHSTLGSISALRPVGSQHSLPPT